MNNAKQLSDRFREVLLNGKWIANTNWQDQLENVTFEQATTQVANLNTIALLTFHVDYYLAGLNHFFEQGSLDIRDKFSFNMEALKDDEAWQQLKNRLFQNAETFAHHVDQLTDEQLKAHFVKEDYGTYARNVEAMIEHSYYHLGQVSLIKKMVQTQASI